MNLLVLMAGPSDKYREAGHTFPKNLVEIDGRPVIEHVLGNLSSLLGNADQLVLALRHEEIVRFHTDRVARLLNPKVQICQVGDKTAGAACTALLAIEHIDDDTPLIVTNGDQIIQADLKAATADFQKRKLDGGIVTFDGVHPRWSFVRCDADGLVVEAAEKRPISRFATAGFYYFARGRDFVRAAQQMIVKDAHVDGSFYVCPAYNELLLENARIGVHNIPRSAYFSLATPQAALSYGEALRSQASQ